MGHFPDTTPVCSVDGPGCGCVMDNQWESIFVYSVTPPDHPYLPNVEKPVYIFGDRYNSVRDRTAIADRLRSLFWMTYRSGFPPVVTQNGPTSDSGWGCMHRCSQMMLAEAVTRVRLGCDWRWKEGCTDEVYGQLRRLFQDHKNSLYSIQNISMVGMAFDKPIGSWFGPNTAVQVIKKLCAYDPRTKWYVHISVEDGIIMDEIKAQCRKQVAHLWNTDATENLSGLPFAAQLPEEGTESEWELGAMKARFVDDTEVVGHNPQISGPVTRDLDEDFLEIVIPPTFEYSASATAQAAADPISAPDSTNESEPKINQNSNAPGSSSPCPCVVNPWRPLLLFIPLRLGLSQPNPCYFNAIKSVLRIKQCIGILGGRPSHAVWIVGVIEDSEDMLLCLDPHFTQPASSEEGHLNPADDLTHHCEQPIRMPLQRLDPSLVLGFVCPTEADFDTLYANLETEVLSGTEQRFALFELHRTRPSNLPPISSRSIAGTGWAKWPMIEDDAEGGSVDSDRPLLVLMHEPRDSGDGSIGNATNSPDNAPEPDEYRLGAAVNAVRDIWSKCNRAAEGAVRSLAKFTGQTGTDEETRPV